MVRNGLQCFSRRAFRPLLRPPHLTSPPESASIFSSISPFSFSSQPNPLKRASIFLSITDRTLDFREPIACPRVTHHTLTSSFHRLLSSAQSSVHHPHTLETRVPTSASLPSAHTLRSEPGAMAPKAARGRKASKPIVCSTALHMLPSF